MRRVRSLFPFYRWRFIELALLGEVSEQRQVSNSESLWPSTEVILTAAFVFLTPWPAVTLHLCGWASSPRAGLIGASSIALWSLCCVGDFLLLTPFWSHFCLCAFLTCKFGVPPGFLAVEWPASALCLWYLWGTYIQLLRVPSLCGYCLFSKDLPVSLSGCGLCCLEHELKMDLPIIISILFPQITKVQLKVILFNHTYSTSLDSTNIMTVFYISIIIRYMFILVMSIKHKTLYL